MEQLGRYRLLEELGSGGFAVVYKAESVGEDRSLVALKCLHSNLTHEDPGFLESLREEARICSLIHHHNVVRVYELAYDYDVRGEPQYYMVMELVEGLTLEALTWMTAKAGVRLPAAVSLDLMAQVADGLFHVHTLTDAQGRTVGMVHRDLKPSNVLVDGNGVSKILDFGIAKALDSSGPKTATGMTRGTAAYMAPEQAFARQLTPAADQFAFGALLFFVTVGEPLIRADTMAAELLSVVNTPPEHRVDEADAVIPGLGEIMLRLRQPDPEDRYASMAEVAASLRALRQAQPLTVATASYLRSLLSDPRAKVSRNELARMRGRGSGPVSLVTMDHLGPQQLDRSGVLVTPEEAALSWAQEAGEELSVADLDPLPLVPDERETMVMPSAETEAVTDPVVSAAVPQATPTDAVPRATPADAVPAAPAPTPTPGATTESIPDPFAAPVPQATPTEPAPAAEEEGGMSGWIYALLLFPLLALLVGVVLLAMVRLWQTGDQELPTELAQLGTHDPQPELITAAPDRGDIRVEEDETITPAEVAEEVTPEVLEPATPEVDPAQEQPTPAPPEPATESSDRPEPATPEPATPEPPTPEPPPVQDDPPGPAQLGALRLNAYPAARVYVDGEFVGTTLETAKGIELPAGDREVRLVRSSDGYEQTIHVVIKARKILPIAFEWDDS